MNRGRARSRTTAPATKNVAIRPSRYRPEAQVWDWSAGSAAGAVTAVITVTATLSAAMIRRSARNRGRAITARAANRPIPARPQLSSTSRHICPAAISNTLIAPCTLCSVLAIWADRLRVPSGYIVEDR